MEGNTITIGDTVVTATLAENTAQYTFGFAGWGNTTGLTNITGTITITATFTKTVNEYTVTLAVNDEEHGSITETSISVPYGSTIVVDGNTITIGDEEVAVVPSEACYQVESWGDDLPETITGDANFVAQIDIGDISHWSYIRHDDGDDYAYAYNTPTNNLQGNIEIPSKVKVEGVVYPVTTIAENAFRSCLISNVIIPSSVTSIGASAFYYCNSLQEVIIDSSSIATSASIISDSYILNNASTVYVKDTIDSSTVTLPSGFDLQATSDKTGYNKWVKNS